MFSRKGFTLLELLVVIGIIGILVGLGSVSYSAAQKKARDAKRQGDIKMVQNALEQYYSTCGFTYPGSAGGPVGKSIVPTIVCPTTGAAILPSVPLDPKLGSGYDYNYDNVNNSYTLCANTMETLKPTGFCVNSQQ